MTAPAETGRCEPPEGTAKGSRHILRRDNNYCWPCWFEGQWVSAPTPISPESMWLAGWRYVRAFDPAAEFLTDQARAVLDAAVQVRQWVRDGHGFFDVCWDLCKAVDAYQPYAPPDPVKAARERIAGAVDRGDVPEVDDLRIIFKALDAAIAGGE